MFDIFFNIESYFVMIFSPQKDSISPKIPWRLLNEYLKFELILYLIVAGKIGTWSNGDISLLLCFAE